jgi:hypothetical protein
MVNGSRGGFYIVGNRNGNNAECEVATVGPTLSKSAEANALLIVAAPELLAAAIYAREVLAPQKDDDFVWSAISQLTAAIAKATKS